MRFTYTGDIHWGMYPDASKPWGKERAQTIKDIFQIIIEKAEEMDVDCLFISRDLSHRQPLTKDSKEIGYLFFTIPVVKVILTAGDHSHIGGNSALLSFTWSPDMTFIMDKAPTSAYFEDINTGVHGFSYHTAEIKVLLLEDIQAPLNSRIQILMAHSGDTAHLPINFNSLELPPFSYIALGHIHKPHVLADGKIAYRGFPEPPDLTETGSHGFYAGEIHPITRKLMSLQSIPVASLQYISLAMNVSKDTINERLCDRISNEIEDRGSQHIYQFRTRGTRDPNAESDLEQLTVRYRTAEIINDSEPQYDSSAPLAEHSGDVIGFYIQALQKEDMSPVEKRALYCGVNALLYITGERN